MKPDKVVALVELLFEECRKDGTLRVAGSVDDYIYFERFKAFIMKHKGIDHHTIKAYKDLFESYHFLQFDEYGRVIFIYKKSPDYLKYKAAGSLTKWF
jgi:hypothetical protein